MVFTRVALQGSRRHAHAQTGRRCPFAACRRLSLQAGLFSRETVCPYIHLPNGDGARSRCSLSCTEVIIMMGTRRVACRVEPDWRNSNPSMRGISDIQQHDVWFVIPQGNRIDTVFGRDDSIPCRSSKRVVTFHGNRVVHHQTVLGPLATRGYRLCPPLLPSRLDSSSLRIMAGRSRMTTIALPCHQESSRLENPSDTSKLVCSGLYHDFAGAHRLST